eukprot:scaffold3069_cov215-Amphora_coffeaeformis.AAC.25
MIIQSKKKGALGVVVVVLCIGVVVLLGAVVYETRDWRFDNTMMKKVNSYHTIPCYWYWYSYCLSIPSNALCMLQAFDNIMVLPPLL